MPELATDQKHFLDDNPYVGTVTTLRRDGSPHATIVWVDVRDGVVGFNTARGRAKVRHIERDPRVSLLVVDPRDPMRWVAIAGRAELVDEGADEQMDRLAKKYTGEDRFENPTPDQARVQVRIRPEHVDSSGFD